MKPPSVQFCVQIPGHLKAELPGGMRGLHFVERGIADFPDICIVQGDRDAGPAREKDPDKITVRFAKELRKDVRAWIARKKNC